MNSLDAYKIEVRLQLEYINKIIEDMNRYYVKEDKKIIFTGAGDSYAAAMEAMYVSNYKARFIDPLELSLQPELAKDSLLYIISISGYTNANIDAALSTKGLCKRIAITANPNSKLARIVDEIIELRYKSLGITTAGSIGFTASLIAALSIVRKLNITNLNDIYKAAEANAKDIRFNNHIYIVGNSITYPLAIYATAKIYEILGLKAQYAMLEEFCHMEIFSLNNDDTVLLLADNKKAEMLYNKLPCNKYIIHNYNTVLLDNILYYTFLIQLLMIENAKILGIDDCYFVKNKVIRDISSALIY